MSKSRQIQEMCMQILADGERHTMQEFVQGAIDAGLISTDQRGMVRSAVAYLRKKNQNLIMEKPGVYWFRDPEEVHLCNVQEKTLEAIQSLQRIAKWYQSPAWLSLSSEERKEAKENYDLLIGVLKDTFFNN